MELVGPLCDLEVKGPTNTNDAYFKIAALDRELNAWYSALPEDLEWTAQNMANGPASLFLLHSQYHTALILLHRPFVDYGERQSGQRAKEPESSQMNHFTMLSRTICGENAKRVASIFKRYRERFDLTQVFVTAMQHAGTAATAMMAEIIIQANAIERKELLGNLACLKQTLSLMSRTYQPAILMASVVDHFIRDFQRGKENVKASSFQQILDPAVEGPSHVSDSSLDVSSSPWNPKKRFQDPQTGSSSPYKRPNRSTHSIFTPRGARGQSPKGLPFLPSSWLEELDFEDTEFLNLMGSRELQGSVEAGGLLSSSCFPGDGDFGALN